MLMKYPEVYIKTPWYVTICRTFPLLNFLLSRRVSIEVDCETTDEEDPYVLELKARARLPRWFRPKFLNIEFRPNTEITPNIRVRFIGPNAKVEYIRSIDRGNAGAILGKRIGDNLDANTWYSIYLDERDSTNPRL